MKIHYAKTIAEGYAYGKCFLTIAPHYDNLEINSVEEEKNKLKTALKKAADSIVNQSKYEYFDVQKMIISDPLLLKEAIDLIEEYEIPAVKALNIALDKYKDILLSSNSTYLQERIYDLEDVKRRITLLLLNKENNFPKERFILVTDELMPSIFLENRKYIVGIIAKRAGLTSHGAILARSYGIPFVVVNELPFYDGEELVIDTRRRAVFEEPSAKFIQEIQVSESILCESVYPHEGFLLLANVFGNEEISKVNKLGFDGVGLYRTEFVFMNEDKPLSEETQREIYTEAVKGLNGKPICFRTFDIGDDKQIAYIKAHHKGFLNYINNKDLFETQIRALIASNIYGNLKIMFPMVANKEEFEYLRAWVLRVKNEMHDDRPLLIGMMLETKSALENISDFDKADFISIGTNDLTTDLYQIRRDEIENGIANYIADLSKRLQKVVKFCKDNNKCLSVCGELAAIPTANTLFMGIGIRNFSVSCSAFKDLNESVKNYINKDQVEKE